MSSTSLPESNKPTNNYSTSPTPWTDTYRQAVLQATVSENAWIRQRPTSKQTEFLIQGDAPEILFGGSAGPGKSSALLMAALQYVDAPGYASIIFRRTYTALALPGGLIDRSHEWLQGTAARWDATEKTWRFPGGGVLCFGYLDAGNDRYRYQSSEYQTIAFDELTEFREEDYLFLFSRLRRLQGSPVPLRMRAASNPGGPGHAWVKRRFLTPDSGKAGRLYIPARLEDNPHLDREQYRLALSNLPGFERRQLLEGDWSEFSGNVFRPRDWPRWNDDQGDSFILQKADGTRLRNIRKADVMTYTTCDPATSAKSTADHTAILTLGAGPNGELLILDAFRKQIDAGQVVDAIARVCQTWRPAFIALEVVGFQKLLGQEASRRPGIPPVREVKPQGKSKLHRAYPAIIRAERGEIYLPRLAPSWLDDLETELAAFRGDNDDHDDLVDCLAYGVLTVPTVRYAGPEDDYGIEFWGGKGYPDAPRVVYRDEHGRPRFMGALGYGAEGPCPDDPNMPAFGRRPFSDDPYGWQ